MAINIAAVLSTNAASQIQAVPDVTFYNTALETAFVCARSGQEQLTASFLHKDVSGPAELSISTVQASDNADCTPTHQIDLSLAEARLLRDLLNSLSL